MKKMMVLVIGMVLALTACDNGNTGGGEGTPPKPDPVEGTWVGTLNQITYKLVVANGSFTQYNDNVMSNKGTYTVSKNTVTMTWTHKYENNEWVTSSTTLTGTISGNTLIFEALTFTKQ